MGIRVRSDAVLIGAVVVLVAAAGYELAVALKVIHLGQSPGVGAPGEGTAATAGLIALLVGIVTTFVMIVRPATPARRVWMLPVSAAVFTTARYFSFDPYYAPDLRRYSDGGLVAGAWIYVLCACCAVCAGLIAARPRRWIGACPVLLLLCAGTVLFEGAGH